MSAEDLVDAHIATHRTRIGGWQRDELLILARDYRALGPKGCAKQLPLRSVNATARMAERMGLITDIPRGPRPATALARLKEAA